MAFTTPSRPDWRWRIVNYQGDMVEESYQTFPSIATAVTEGTRRLNELSDQQNADQTYDFARTRSPRRNR